ncbi:MAG: hypothetical protein K8S22_13570 [Betaproteobacteria bacterium]|nr:hypothetical protein [Betaproteobacteria bacterium]
MLVIQLTNAARDSIAGHLLALNAEDRRLRFGYGMADETIANYVQRIDFNRDALFGVYNAKLHLVGVCHVAQTAGVAEFGVSVYPGERNRGIGSLGMRVVTGRGEADGQLALPAGDLDSLVDEGTQQSIAIYDYSIKANIGSLQRFVRGALPVLRLE